MTININGRTHEAIKRGLELCIGNSDLCVYCKHDSYCPHTIPDCINCKDENCQCYSCNHQSNWQWRGVQESNYEQTLER